jgi:hypothetical protein
MKIKGEAAKRPAKALQPKDELTNEANHVIMNGTRRKI